MEAKFLTVFANLKASDDKAAFLTDIKILANAASNSDLQQIVGHNETNDLFEYLGYDRETSDITADILDRLFNSVDPVIVFRSYSNQLLIGLKHEKPRVRQLCCLQLKRVCEADASLLINEPEFLIPLIDCICQDDSDADSGDSHKLSAEILSKIGSSENGQITMYSVSSPVLIHLKNCLTKHSSTVWFRLMQIVVESCSHSASAMRTCETNNLLHALAMKVKDSSDVLSQAVAIELLSQLSSSYHGYIWLVKQDVVSYLMYQIDSEDDPFAALTKPIILKFFAATLSSHPPHVTKDCNTIYGKLCTIITEGNTDLLPNAVDCLGVVARLNAAKHQLKSLGSLMTNTVRRLGIISREGNSELRVDALRCISTLISTDTEDSPDSEAETEALCEEWFSYLDNQPLEYLLKISKNPFKDLRLAVHLIYIGMARQLWGQKAMKEHPTFCEYLLDRTTEKEKEGSELKYQIITTIIHSDYASKVFKADYIIKLKVYERQGPLFVLASSQVAFEEA